MQSYMTQHTTSCWIRYLGKFELCQQSVRQRLQSMDHVAHCWYHWSVLMAWHGVDSWSAQKWAEELVLSITDFRPLHSRIEEKNELGYFPGQINWNLSFYDGRRVLAPTFARFLEKSYETATYELISSSVCRERPTACIYLFRAAFVAMMLAGHAAQSHSTIGWEVIWVTRNDIYAGLRWQSAAGLSRACRRRDLLMRWVSLDLPAAHMLIQDHDSILPY